MHELNNYDIFQHHSKAVIRKYENIKIVDVDFFPRHQTLEFTLVWQLTWWDVCTEMWKLKFWCHPTLSFYHEVLKSLKVKGE